MRANGAQSYAGSTKPFASDREIRLGWQTQPNRSSPSAHMSLHKRTAQRNVPIQDSDSMRRTHSWNWPTVTTGREKTRTMATAQTSPKVLRYPLHG